MIRSIHIVSGALALAAILAPPLTAQEPVYAIRNATIVPVSGPRIPNGTVVIRGRRIEAVGANVTVPPGATVIDGTGLFVYPGLIDSGTELGLSEIGSVPGSTDTREIGTFNPHNDALIAVNPHSEHFPTTRVNGITSAVTSATGGLISGSAALIDLAGWTPDQMAVVPRAGMVVSYPRIVSGRGRFRPAGGDGDATAEANRAVQQLYGYFREAKAYSDARARMTAAGTSPKTLDLPMEAMMPAVRGEMPVIVQADDADQIRGALALADSFHLKIVIRGAQEAWMLADTLAARKIPVIVGPTVATPGGDDPYDMIYANPGVLAKAGVTIAFQTSGEVGDTRNLPYNAALATAYGLDPDEALRAVTINPAKIWGAGDRLGSVETGKIANLIVTTGDPLDVRTIVKDLFIQGERVSLASRHTKLYDEFRARPKP